VVYRIAACLNQHVRGAYLRTPASRGSGQCTQRPCRDNRGGKAGLGVAAAESSLLAAEWPPTPVLEEGQQLLCIRKPRSYIFSADQECTRAQPCWRPFHSEWAGRYGVPCKRAGSLQAAGVWHAPPACPPPAHLPVHLCLQQVAAGTKGAGHSYTRAHPPTCSARLQSGSLPARQAVPRCPLACLPQKLAVAAQSPTLCMRRWRCSSAVEGPGTAPACCEKGYTRVHFIWSRARGAAAQLGGQAGQRCVPYQR